MCLPDLVREDAVACLKLWGIAAGVQAEHVDTVGLLFGLSVDR